MSPPSKTNKCIYLGFAWLVTLIVFILICEPAGFGGLLFSLSAFLFFPAGLARPFISPQSDFESGPGLAILGLLAGWGIYIAISVKALGATTKQRYLVFYSTLCVLLLLNLIGCHKMSKDHWHL
jgi:hypothetical protein